MALRHLRSQSGKPLLGQTSQWVELQFDQDLQLMERQSGPGSLSLLCFFVSKYCLFFSVIQGKSTVSIYKSRSWTNPVDAVYCEDTSFHLKLELRKIRVFGDVSPRWPASILQNLPKVGLALQSRAVHLSYPDLHDDHSTSFTPLWSSLSI